MKVVLDTNIFISGIHWAGDSNKILYHLMNNKFQHITSQEIIKEITETLKDFKKPLPDDQLAFWERFITMKSEVVIPSESINIVNNDPDDNKIIEAAYYGDADYIITQDNHLLKINQYKGISILTPSEFLVILSNNGGKK